MPIYEYLCTECSYQHEALQKINDEPLLECPSCGQPALKKKVSAPGFRLSGSGWYETDFKSDKKRNLADSGDKSAGDRKDADKGDSTKSTDKAVSDKAVSKESSSKKDAVA